MDITALYTNDLKQIDKLIQQAKNKKNQIIMQKLQNPAEKERILKWAAHNPLGIIILIKIAEDDSITAAVQGYDETDILGWDYDYIKEWFGEDFADILNQAKSDISVYNYLDCNIEVEKNIWLNICQTETNTLDDWNYEDNYDINSDASWLFSTIKEYINEDIDRFKRYCIQDGFVNYAIERFGSEELIKEGFISKEGYKLVAVKGKEQELYNKLKEAVNTMA